MKSFTHTVSLAWIALASPWLSFPSAANPDRDLTQYFRAETLRLTTSANAPVTSLAEWQSQRDRYRSELQDMLGLKPFPERTDLKPVITGQLEGPGIVVEKIHFQSQPGLYVTANLYRPKSQSGRLPAILYVCGHAQVITNGVSCGNKTGYQHHGIWFAQHGYVALLIDTLQLGEIEGLHHGTYRLGQWWWNSRGYTPAGVEAWNGIRAIDYLVSRPEVDPSRIGITGRSGGGSYSWTTAALDDRIRVAAPVAGITDLHNHVVDGVVEGHCDCMYFVNTFRWDYARNAQLLAPRPLLIVNTDADRIFPLEGVQRIHAATRQIYRLHGADASLGLVIGPGDHKDTQDLQVPVFRWFNRHLKGEDPLISDPAVKLFSPLDLRVFRELPADQRNTRAAEWFGPFTPYRKNGSPPAAPWPETLKALRSRTFAAWPEHLALPDLSKVNRERESGIEWTSGRFESQEHVNLEIVVAVPHRKKPQRLLVHVLDDAAWVRFTQWRTQKSLAERATELPPDTAIAWFAPRGIGASTWAGDARRQTQIRRRFMLLGQTLDGMRVWDVLQALNLANHLSSAGPLPTEIYGHGSTATHALLAAFFAPQVNLVRVPDLPDTFLDGPDYLNILQVLDIPQAKALAEKHGVRIQR